MRRLIFALTALLLSAQVIAQVNYQGTQTNNQNSSALGMNTKALGAASFASGLNSESDGISSHALGMNAHSDGLYSLAAGVSAHAQADYSMALGSNVRSAALRSVVIGAGPASSILENTKANSLAIGFNSDLPTLFVSASQGPGTWGRVGIGTSDPSSRLEINAQTQNGLLIRSSGTQGFGMRVESTQPSSQAISILLNGDTTLAISSTGELRMDNCLFAKEVKVRLNVWKDMVFREGRDLGDLDALARYIQTHHRLPGLPSEEEALSEPTDLGQLFVILLEKVEETTLFLLEMRQEIIKLDSRITELSNKPTNTISP